MNAKPRKVKAKITRVVTEIALVYLDANGVVDEYHSSCEELDSEVTEIHGIHTVLSVHG
jgi:hypothetical protein